MDLVWHLRITSSVIMIYKIHHWWKLSTSVFSTTHWKKCFPVSQYKKLSAKQYPSSSSITQTLSTTILWNTSLKRYPSSIINYYPWNISLNHYPSNTINHYPWKTILPALSLKHDRLLQYRKHYLSSTINYYPWNMILHTLSLKHQIYIIILKTIALIKHAPWQKIMFCFLLTRLIFDSCILLLFSGLGKGWLWTLVWSLCLLVWE